MRASSGLGNHRRAIERRRAHSLPLVYISGHQESSGPMSARRNATGAEPKRTRRHYRRSSDCAAMSSLQPTPGTAAPATRPCGACKFLRRRCAGGCIFAPHFRTEQGAARFAAVHRVFGASNVSKLLHQVPVACRGDAAATICYEAQARIADPVYGCVPTIIALQQQVASLHAELSIVQMQLLSRTVSMADNIAPCARRQVILQHQHVEGSRPSCSSNPSASDTNPFSGASCLDDDAPRGLGTLRLWQSSSRADGDEEDDRERGGTDAFIDEVLVRRK